MNIFSNNLEPPKKPEDSRIPSYLWEYLNEKVALFNKTWEEVEGSRDLDAGLAQYDEYESERPKEISEIEAERLEAKRELLAEIIGVIVLYNSIDDL